MRQNNMGKHTKVIAITGGVGSGKSTVTKILEEKYEAFLINTDKIAHSLMKRGAISYRLIVEYFGETILDENKEINRRVLGEVVYKEKEALKKLNSFTHPYVMKEVNHIIEEQRKKSISIICVETALPKEANLKSFCDQIWFVYTPMEVRKERLRTYRNYTDEKINKIMKNQLSDEEYKRLSTHVIMNEESLEMVEKQIDEILNSHSYKYHIGKGRT